jgi:hypothetical protein
MAVTDGRKRFKTTLIRSLWLVTEPEFARLQQPGRRAAASG